MGLEPKNLTRMAGVLYQLVGSRFFLKLLFNQIEYKYV